MDYVTHQTLDVNEQEEKCRFHKQNFWFNQEKLGFQPQDLGVGQQKLGSHQQNRHLNNQEKVLFNQQKMVGVIKDHGDVYHHDTKMEVSHIPGVVSTRKMMESQLLSIIPGYPRYDGKLGSSIQHGKYVKILWNHQWISRFRGHSGPSPPTGEWLTGVS